MCYTLLSPTIITREFLRLFIGKLKRLRKFKIPILMYKQDIQEGIDFACIQSYMGKRIMMVRQYHIDNTFFPVVFSIRYRLRKSKTIYYDEVKCDFSGSNLILSIDEFSYKFINPSVNKLIKKIKFNFLYGN
jgi:hypothetical protein